MWHFPKDFLWGASTSSHQIEGNTHNQWSEWEQKHARELAKTAAKRLHWLPNWDAIADKAQDPANYRSGIGVDHYTRYAEDFDILQRLKMNAFRCGIEWSRLEPQEGVWDQAALQHYRTYFSELQKRGITPVVTLWHWTMPVWFAQKGGFAKRSNLRYFERYVQKVCEILGSDIRYVITVNEPNVYTAFSYGNGDWPPEHKSKLEAAAVYRNLAAAHKRAYQIIKSVHPDIQVGAAPHLVDAHPANPRNILNKLSINVQRYIWNWWFLQRIRRHQDFIGVNYYFTEYRDWRGRIKNPSKPLSDLGWYMEPAGIRSMLNTTWRRYHIPLLITENGLADAQDSQREWWLEQTIPALDGALQDGVELIGYLHWSLLDNFEWKFGWWPEFGLVHVDRTTQQRTIRQSAALYASMIIEARNETQPKA